MTPLNPLNISHISSVGLFVCSFVCLRFVLFAFNISMSQVKLLDYKAKHHYILYISKVCKISKLLS